MKTSCEHHLMDNSPFATSVYALLFILWPHPRTEGVQGTTVLTHFSSYTHRLVGPVA